MTNEQCGISGQHDHANLCLRKRISWSAIIIGALVGIGLSFLLNLFSVAIDLSLVKTTAQGMMMLAVGGFIGIAIGTFVSMFVAGYAAGYLGRPYCVRRNLGVVYGFSAWCVALILMILLAASMSRYVAFYTEFVSHPTMVVGTDKMVSMVDAKPVSSKKMKANNQSKTMMTTDTQTAANTFGMSSLLIFVLFFIGAFASCIGGHCGMTSCCKEESTR